MTKMGFFESCPVVSFPAWYSGSAKRRGKDAGGGDDRRPAVTEHSAAEAKTGAHDEPCPARQRKAARRKEERDERGEASAHAAAHQGDPARDLPVSAEESAAAGHGEVVEALY